MMNLIGMTTILIIAGSLIVSVVIIVFVQRYVRRLSGADLQATGEPATATILKMWDTGTTVNQHPVVGMLLNVQSTTSGAYEVETKSLVPRLAVGQIQPGAQVRVKIDPANRQRVVLDLYGQA